MAVATVHVLHGIQSASPSFFLSQISNARVTPDIQVMLSQSAGLPFPLFAANMSTNPGVTLDTPQVKSILDLSGALSSIVNLSGGNTDLYFKKVDDLGRRVADASPAHLRFRMSQAWLSLGQITAGHNREATASIRVGTTFDGTNNPLVPAGSTALAGTSTSAEHFVAGPASINLGAGVVALPGVEDVTIDFGRQVLEVGADGELYITFAACQSYSPVITLRSYENIWTTYGLNGSVSTAVNVWLRKVAPTGRVANATEEHILFTGTTGLVTVDESGGGVNEPSMTSLRISLVGANATTEPIAVDTTAAIS
jgi:hypothetical protein